MAAADVLGAFLDFLNYSSDNEKENSTLDTPHIDKVLQKYHHQKSSTQGNDKKVGVTSQRYPSNRPDDYGDRIVLLETQLKELMKQNESLMTKTTAAKTRGGASSDSDSSQQEKENKKAKSKTKRAAVSSLAEDKKTRLHLKATPTSHTHHKTGNPSKREIEEERERRWKAEQAAVRLAEHVRHLQLQVDELNKKLETSIVHRNQLETGLIKEKEKIVKLNEEKKNLQLNQSDEQNELNKLKKRYEDQSLRLKNLEEQLEKAENARSSLYHEMSEKVKESEVKAATSEHDLLLQQQLVRKLQEQLHELQELLATREKEHIKELERLDCRNVQNVVEKEIRKERMRCETLVVQHKEKYEQQRKAYCDLEDEFRAALRIEAARYQQLESTHEKLLEELTVSRESLSATTEKDKKSTKLINELSTIVKQQKSQIAGLLNKQQDIMAQFRDKSKQFDTEIVLRAKFEERVTSLQQENSDLAAKLAAQESLLKGLREEKKLWSKELADQGASLAQDRGRLESQIESLRKQVLELQETQQANKTTIRVREKVIEDQTSTIKHLKQETSDLKSNISSIQSDWTNRFDMIQSELEQERVTVQELHKQLEMITEEKLSYEEQLGEVQEGERKWKDRYSKLKSQWEERVGLIVELENNVKQLQEKGKKREEELVNERDSAHFEYKKAMESFESMKAKLSDQTLSFQQLLKEKIQEALREKQKEVDEANLRIAAVEEEMKQVLSETARERKAMETKFQRLSKAFQDMQKELD